MFTINIVNKRFNMLRSFEQNKNVIYIHFIITALNFTRQSFNDFVS